jgi:hypothetical protein
MQRHNSYPFHPLLFLCYWSHQFFVPLQPPSLQPCKYTCPSGINRVSQTSYSSASCRR